MLSRHSLPLSSVNTWFCTHISQDSCRTLSSCIQPTYLIPLALPPPSAPPPTSEPSTFPPLTSSWLDFTISRRLWLCRLPMSVTLGRALGAQVQPLMAILMSPRVRTCSLDSGKSPGLRGEYKLHWETALKKSAALRRLGNVLRLLRCTMSTTDPEPTIKSFKSS